MSHVRSEIRAYVAEKLTEGDTFAGNRVYNSKILSEQGPFPCIAVYTTGEKTLERTAQSPEYRKEIILELQIVVKNNATYATDLDALCLQIEALLDFDYTLGGLVESNEPDETEILFNDKGEVQLAMAKMTYKIAYITSLPDITASLDKFNVFHGDIDANDPTTTGELGPDGQIDASIHITGLNP